MAKAIHKSSYRDIIFKTQAVFHECLFYTWQKQGFFILSEAEITFAITKAF